MSISKSILYVEDNGGLARIVQKRLERLGYVVDLAETGQEGLTKIDERRYDAIIIDYDLPDFKGTDLIREAQALPPTIMVTAYSDPAMAVEALKNGALEYLVKDSENYLDYLPTVIEQALEQQKLIDEKKVAEQNRELLIQELDAFTHTVAHDLKSPLSIIINATTLLHEKDIAWDDESQILLEHIRLTGKKMFNIIEELLLLAHIRQNETNDLFLHEVDMTTVVQDSLFRLEQILVQYDAEVIVPDDLPSAYGYAPWLEEVWVNYVSNALKYGGNPPRLKIEARTTDDYVEYAVIDNGAGIPPDKQSKLFTPFVRLADARLNSDGHGLGLSIVHRILEQLNGTVGMENSDSDEWGARFWFRLPSATSD